MAAEDTHTPQRASYTLEQDGTPEMLELYGAIVGTIPQSLFLLDADRYIIGLFNVDPITLSGYSLQDIVGKHIGVFANDPASPLYQACSLLDQHFGPVFETGIPRRFEYRIDNYHLEATISKIQGNRILSQVRDITQIVEERQEIDRKKSNELALALTAGGVVPWNYDVQTRYFTAPQENNVIGNGLTFAEMNERIAPEYRQTVADAFDDLISGRKKHCEFTILVRNQANQMQWSNVHAVPHIYSPTGEVLALTGSQKDASREYEMTREIENSRAKLALAIRSGGLQLWEYDPQDDSIEISNMKRQVRMCFSDEFRATVHPDDLDAFDSDIRKLISGEESGFQSEVRFLLNGRCRWFAINATLFGGTAAKATIIGLTKEITADIQATKELIELRDKAEEANRLKSAFIANMSHEIRTPLNAIIGFSTMLATTDDKEEKQKYLEVVQYNNSLLLNLISDVLDLSRLEMGSRGFSFSEIRIDPFFRQLLASAHLKLAPEVKLNYNLEDRTLGFTSDLKSLTQILTNFLTNAAKFTRQGEIRLGCCRAEGGLRFYVRDTGCGIPKDKQSEIFKRFVKLSDYTQGTGLGLSICQTVVSLLGGTIGVESEPGKGSEFWCILPDGPTE